MTDFIDDDSISTVGLSIFFADTRNAAIAEGATELGQIKDVSDLGGLKVNKYKKTRLNQKKEDGSPDLVNKYSTRAYMDPQPIKFQLGSKRDDFEAIVGQLEGVEKYFAVWLEGQTFLVGKGAITETGLKGKMDDEVVMDVTIEALDAWEFVVVP